MVTSSKMAICISQPMSLKVHSNTCEHLAGLRNRPINFWCCCISHCYILRLLIKLYLTIVCVYVIMRRVVVNLVMYNYVVMGLCIECSCRVHGNTMDKGMNKCQLLAFKYSLIFNFECLNVKRPHIN